MVDGLNDHEIAGMGMFFAESFRWMGNAGCGTKNGLKQTLLTTCKAHGINGYQYLVDVLQRIDQHPASRVHELTPLQWQMRFSNDPLRPPLHQIRKAKQAI